MIVVAESSMYHIVGPYWEAIDVTYGLNRGHSIPNFPGSATDKVGELVMKTPNIDLKVRDLQELQMTLESLNKLDIAITVERLVVGNNVVQVSQKPRDAECEYMITGIWPAGSKEGVVRQ